LQEEREGPFGVRGLGEMVCRQSDLSLFFAEPSQRLVIALELFFGELDEAAVEESIVLEAIERIFITKGRQHKMAHIQTTESFGERDRGNVEQSAYFGGPKGSLGDREEGHDLPFEGGEEVQIGRGIRLKGFLRGLGEFLMKGPSLGSMRDPATLSPGKDQFAHTDGMSCAFPGQSIEEPVWWEDVI